MDSTYIATRRCSPGCARAMVSSASVDNVHRDPFGLSPRLVHLEPLQPVGFGVPGSGLGLIRQARAECNLQVRQTD